jgi:hypothetical protein
MLNFGFCLFHRPALLLAEKHAQLMDVRPDRFDAFEQKVTALFGARIAPLLERVVCRIHGALGIFAPAFLDHIDEFLRRGIADFIRLIAD